MPAEIQLCWWKILDWRRRYGLQNIILIECIIPVHLYLQVSALSTALLSPCLEQGDREVKDLECHQKAASAWGRLVSRAGGWVSQGGAGLQGHCSWVRHQRGDRGGLWGMEGQALRAVPTYPLKCFHQGDKTVQLLSCFCSLQSFWCVSKQLKPFTPGKTAVVHESNHVWSVIAKTKLYLRLIWMCFRHTQTAIFAFCFSAAFHKEKAWKNYPICWRLIS